MERNRTQAMAFAILRLLDDAVDEILRTEDAATFLAWMREQAPERYPELFGPIPDEDLQANLAAAFGRSIWDVTPLPGNGYEPCPLPRPGDLEPCPCGSGGPYGRCCARLPSLPGASHEDAWGRVVERVPLEDVAARAEAGELPRGAAIKVARRMVDEEQPERALALLEPLAGEPAQLKAGDEALLRTLLDALDEQGDTARRDAYHRRLERELPDELKSVFSSQQALRLAGGRESGRAWDLLWKAQREDPVSSTLASIEISLLLVEGRLEQAVERARFWRARLRRTGQLVTDETWELLDDVIHNPHVALLRFACEDSDPQVERLARLLTRLPAPPEEPLYRFQACDQHPEVGWLVPADEVAARDREWAEAFEQEKPDLVNVDPFEESDAWERAERWLAWLEAHPRACDSLSVLDDLARAAEQAATRGGGALYQGVLEPITRRAWALLERARADIPGAALPWDFEANRPALRLLISGVVVARVLKQEEHEIDLMETLLTLDCRDQTIRGELANQYLRRGDDAQMLSLAEDWEPEQNAENLEVLYGEVLALYRLGRQQRARKALERAAALMPLVPRALTAEQPGQVRPDAVLPADDEERAWMYRAAMGEVWQTQPELLDWLRERAEGEQRKSG